MAGGRIWIKVEGRVTNFNSEGDVFWILDREGREWIRWTGHDYELLSGGEWLSVGDKVAFDTCADEQLMYKTFVEKEV